MCTCVCRSCSPKVEACKHSASGCASCDEMHYFKQDILKCAEKTEDEDILGRSRALCESIDTMIGHTARQVNQERYWPELLDRLRESKEYDHVLLKSDYWKKFEGTVQYASTSTLTRCPISSNLNHSLLPNFIRV